MDVDGIGNLVDFPTIIHKIFETNSSFHVKYGKVLIPIFQQFFVSINNIFILRGRLGTTL